MERSSRSPQGTVMDTLPQVYSTAMSCPKGERQRRLHGKHKSARGGLCQAVTSNIRGAMGPYSKCHMVPYKTKSCRVAPQGTVKRRVLFSACAAHLTVDDPESKVCVECKLDRLNGLSIGPR